MTNVCVLLRKASTWMGGATHSGVEQLWCQAWQDNNANVTELVERTRAVAGGAEVLLVGRVVSATLQSSVLIHGRWRWRRQQRQRQQQHVASGALTPDTSDSHKCATEWRRWMGIIGECEKV